MKQKTKRMLIIGVVLVVLGLVIYFVSEPIATGLRNLLRKVDIRYGYNIHLIIRYVIALVLMLGTLVIADVKFISNSSSDDSEN
ncbi:hypothetical protein UT300012_21450 [Paraclostridium bifermentans]